MILRRFLLALVVLLLLVAAYFYAALHWSYSTGERAGWIQKLSDKGWVCKTWEGELALVSIPGTSSVEKFAFTVRDPAVAASLTRVMGKRVTVHYEQKVNSAKSANSCARHRQCRHRRLAHRCGRLHPPLWLQPERTRALPCLCGRWGV